MSSERVRATHTTAVQPTRAVLTALTPRRRPRRTRSLRPLRHVQPRVFWHAACIQSGRRASRAIVAAYKSPLVSRSYLLLHTCALARLTGSDSLGPAAVSVASRLRRSHTARRSRLSGRSRPTFGAGITAERLAASAERSTARAVRRDLLPGQSALFRYRLRGRWSTRKKPGLKVSFLTVLGGSRPSVAPCTPVSGRTASGSLGVRVLAVRHAGAGDNAPLFPERFGKRGTPRAILRLASQTSHSAEPRSVSQSLVASGSGRRASAPGASPRRGSCAYMSERLSGPRHVGSCATRKHARGVPTRHAVGHGLSSSEPHTAPSRARGSSKPWTAPV